MANKVFGFNSVDAESLIQLISSDSVFNDSNFDRKPIFYVAKTPEAGIAARSGLTVSKANCTPYAINDSTLAASTAEVPIYNMSTTAIGGNVYVVAVRAGGVLIAVWEDCVGA
jgi:fructose-specific component phosphotransferase system IIB-like protein